MSNKLFVYGTLMSRASSRLGAQYRARLSRSGSWLGEASIAGRLYDLGRYPGLVEDGAEADRVHGEIIELVDPEAVFTWLDPYEGIEPTSIETAEYRRVVRTASLGAGGATHSSHQVWVYVFVDTVMPEQLCPGRRWLQTR